MKFYVGQIVKCQTAGLLNIKEGNLYKVLDVDDRFRKIKVMRDQIILEPAWYEINYFKSVVKNFPKELL
jgi:hypothetical protein